MGIPERQRKTKDLPHRNSLTLYSDPWHAHRTKEPSLANTKEEEASWGLLHSLPGGRETGGRQGATAISAPETTSPAKLWANHVFLDSWMVCISQESCNLRLATLRRHMAHLVPVPSWYTWRTKQLGQGRCMRIMVCVYILSASRMPSIFCENKLFWIRKYTCNRNYSILIIYTFVLQVTIIFESNSLFLVTLFFLSHQGLCRGDMCAKVSKLYNWGN